MKGKPESSYPDFASYWNKHSLNAVWNWWNELALSKIGAFTWKSPQQRRRSIFVPALSSMYFRVLYTLSRSPCMQPSMAIFMADQNRDNFPIWERERHRRRKGLCRVFWRRWTDPSAENLLWPLSPYLFNYLPTSPLIYINKIYHHTFKDILKILDSLKNRIG